MSMIEQSVRRTPRRVLRPVTMVVAAGTVLAPAARGAGSWVSPSVSSRPGLRRGHLQVFRVHARSRTADLPRPVDDRPRWSACGLLGPDPGDGRVARVPAGQPSVLGDPADRGATGNVQSQSAREQHMLAFARCMRDDHVPNFPDPTAEGQLTLDMLGSAGVDLHSPAVISAASSCIPSADGAISARQVQRALLGEQSTPGRPTALVRTCCR